MDSEEMNRRDPATITDSIHVGHGINRRAIQCCPTRNNWTEVFDDVYLKTCPRVADTSARVSTMENSCSSCISQ